jgi:hypothetical protein
MLILSGDKTHSSFTTRIRTSRVRGCKGTRQVWSKACKSLALCLARLLQLFAPRDCWPGVRSRGMTCAALRVVTRLLRARRDSYGGLRPGVYSHVFSFTIVRCLRHHAILCFAYRPTSAYLLIASATLTKHSPIFTCVCTDCALPCIKLGISCYYSPRLVLVSLLPTHSACL